jgi:DNA repair exonuclease SbcCD ATPase subunit
MTEWFDLSRYDKAVEYARSKLKEWQTELSAIDSEREKAQFAQASLEENKTKLVQIEQDIRDLKDKEIKLRDRQKDFDNYSGLSGNLFLLEEKLREIKDENTDTEEAKKAFSKIDIKALEDEKEKLTKEKNESLEKRAKIREKLNDLRSQLVNPLTCPHCGTSLCIK